jgi:hypothetical protein
LMGSYKLLFCFSAASIATSLHMLEPTVHGVCEISNAVKCRIAYPFVESVFSLHFAVIQPMGHLHASTFLFHGVGYVVLELCLVSFMRQQVFISCLLFCNVLTRSSPGFSQNQLVLEGIFVFLIAILPFLGENM